MNYLKQFILLTGMTLLVSFAAMSQPCPPGPDGLPDCSGGDPGAPFDGGASIIIAAGAGIAAKKAYDKRKAAKAQQ